MIKEINIKNDMPPVDVAISRIEELIESNKLFGDSIIRIVHGYGSNGKGGLIKKELSTLLPIWKKTKHIYDYIKGENFTEITINTRNYPKTLKDLLLNDTYLNNINKGVTILILKIPK